MAEWLTPRLSRFTPGKEIWYQKYRRLGGPHGRLSLPSGLDPRTVWPVANGCTDCVFGARIIL